MTITLDKAIDLVRLVCIPDLQVAFEKYMIEFEPRDYSSPVTGTILRQFRSQFINLPWRLTNENVADLRQRWPRLVAGPNAARVRFPLHRHGIAAGRHFEEDRLIDYWIGLEGLFTRENDRRPEATQVKTRSTALLKLDTTATEEVGKIHGTRGEIVHGKYDYDQERLDKHVAAASRFLTEALTEYLSTDDPL